MEEKNCCLKQNTTKLHVNYPEAGFFFFSFKKILEGELLNTNQTVT